jgi:hypothetical protein
MIVQEYISRKNILIKEHDKKMKELNKEYALSNNTVKIGDIVTDHIGSVKVEKILLWGSIEPSCVYRGIEYTKAGKPYKKGSERDVFQINLIK